MLPVAGSLLGGVMGGGTAAPASTGTVGRAAGAGGEAGVASGDAGAESLGSGSVSPCSMPFLNSVEAEPKERASFGNRVLPKRRATTAKTMRMSGPNISAVKAEVTSLLLWSLTCKPRPAAGEIGL